MTRTPSPLDPRVEVRHVGDQELEAIVRELVEPTRDLVVSWEIHLAIIDQLGLGGDEVRIRAAMARTLEHCDHVGPRRSGMAFGRLRQGLTAHQRMRIARARREDEAAAAQPRPAPIPAMPPESFPAMIDRLLG